MNAETIPTPRTLALRRGHPLQVKSSWAGEILESHEQLERENIALKESLRLKTAESEAWESTAKLVSKSPCGHPNDCAYDKNADRRWANIGCVWCERDNLRAALVKIAKSSPWTPMQDIARAAVPDWGKE